MVKKTVVKKSFIEKLPLNKGEWLKLVIEMTEKSIQNKEADLFLVKQKERLEKELKEWTKTSKQSLLGDC